MTWLEFTCARWGENWALCRATPNNRARYGRCISKREYQRAEADWRRQFPREWLREKYVADSLTLELYDALVGLLIGPLDAIEDMRRKQKAAAALAAVAGDTP